MIDEVVLPFDDGTGRECGSIQLACLAGKAQWNGIDALIDLRKTKDTPSVAAPVQLLEEMSYEYSIDLPAVLEVVDIQPAELVTYTRHRRTGRIETKRATGTISFEITLSDGSHRHCEFEVRARKLDYQTDYRSMLQRIAREAAELVQSSFAASSLRSFQPNTLADPQTLYQRFAFMQSLVTSADVQNALHLIERRPHHQHIETINLVDPARSVRSSRLLVRELTAAGPRQPTAQPIAGLSVVPRRVRERSHNTTYDTVPNQFVKYVLTRWKNLAVEVAERLRTASFADQRGRRESLSTVAIIERALAAPAIREAGRLQSFPQSNQVLQGRAGYRDILEAFLLAEAAATITWDDHEQRFSAGQRDVADLYEHWVFLEIVRIVETLRGFTVDRRILIKKSADGLQLDLRRTGKSVVVARGTRRGRTVEIEVWFNRQFAHHNEDRPGTSWTESLRPDCSLRIAPAGGAIDAATWVHFDAKYRVRSSADVMVGDDGPEASADDPADRPMASDLMKMHAYRDAIRRTAGAYVLYPGSDNAQETQRKQYHEILPGLGAFTLRPTESGEASRSSSKVLQTFLEDIIDHVASQGTAAERSRFWTTQSYRDQRIRRQTLEPALSQPPLDTTVLLGFVRGEEHLDWCLRTGLYNLRADAGRRGSVGLASPELGADFVVLYGADSDETWTFSTSGAFFVRTDAELIADGYPMPGGTQYVCLEIHPQPFSSTISGAHVRALASKDREPSRHSAPRVVTWDQVASPIPKDAQLDA